MIDPSGFGLSDFRDKILRTLILPDEVFAQDPSRLLVAIKYIVLGYKPEEKLEAAMKSWGGGDLDLNKEELERITKEHLLSLSAKDRLCYLKKLKGYQLIEKLFHIAPQATDAQTLACLGRQVGLKSNRSWNDYSMHLFNKPNFREINGALISRSMRPRDWDIFNARKQTERRFAVLDLAESNGAAEVKNFYLERKPLEQRPFNLKESVVCPNVK